MRYVRDCKSPIESCRLQIGTSRGMILAYPEEQVRCVNQIAYF